MYSMYVSYMLNHNKLVTFDNLMKIGKIILAPLVKVSQHSIFDREEFEETVFHSNEGSH